MTRPRARNSFVGVTLVELMIAVALLVVVALLLMGPFKFLALSSQGTKARTLANNLAQEQVEILKNKSYYSLLLTTTTFNDTRFNPAIDYDNAAYPPETVVEGGMSFMRATRVEYAFQNGANLTILPWTNDDSGLKHITVYVMWLERGEWKLITLQNLMSSPQTNMLNARISGTVTRAGFGTPVAGALVRVVENANYYGTADAAGNYSFMVAAGSYTVICSSWSYFPFATTSYQSVASLATLNLPISLTKMSSALVTTDIYQLDHLVISRILGARDNPTGFSQEYVEIFNPTTATWPVAGVLGLKVARRAVQDAVPDTIAIDYTGSPAGIAPGGFYLFANTSPITIGMVSVNADAIWEAAPGGLNETTFAGDAGRFVTTPGSEVYNAIPVDGDFGGGHAAGGVLLYNTATSEVLDRVGWSGNGMQIPHPDVFEGAAIAEFIGLQQDELYARKSSTAGVNATYGPAYDSGNNNVDFTPIGMAALAPRNSATAPQVRIAGTPALGAWMNLNDSISVPGTCVTTLLGSMPVCRYSSQVATGTWTAIAFSTGTGSKNYFKEIGNIVVGASAVSVPNAATTPPWPAAPYAATLMDDTTSYAFIAGTVFNAGGTPLNAVTVSGGGQSVPTSVTGRYFLSVPAGAVDITANPNSLSVPTMSAESLSLLVNAGTLYDTQNFFLSQAGSLRGYFRTSTGVSLPYRSVVALKGVMEAGQGTSDISGNFYVRNLDTGTYIVQPTLDPAETVTPSSATAILATPGTTVFVGTFTIMSGLAQIGGQVLAGGVPINTGVLVVVSTVTLAGGAATPAPSMTGAGGCSPCYYETSSDSLGRYALNVRTSATAYKVYGYYTTFSGTTPTTTRVGPFNVTVSTPSATYSQSLTW